MKYNLLYINRLMASRLLGIVQIFRRKGSSYLITCRDLGFVLKGLGIRVPESLKIGSFHVVETLLGITDTSLSSRAVTVADRGWPFINLIPPNQSFNAEIIKFCAFL